MAPRSKSGVGAWPRMISSGVPARLATKAGVTVLVTPGPRVTAATPGTPVWRPTASAMKAAAASWRVCTSDRPWAAAAE